MYLEHLIPNSLAGLFSPGALIKRLRYPNLVSFGMLANLQNLASKGVFDGVDSVIDVGANIGQFAFMAHTAMPRLPIYSFEPDPGCFVHLRHTFADHQIQGRCFPAAVSDREGEINLHLYESTANNSIFAREGESAIDVCRVDCTTLDVMLKTELFMVQTPFLKIDVQGAELSVLKGSTEVLRRCPYVMLETSLVSSYEGSANIAHVLAFMESLGFSCWEIVDVLRARSTNKLGILEMDLLFRRNGDIHAC